MNAGDCLYCGRDTSIGNGLWVDRIPAFTEERAGWMCRECQACDEPDACFHEDCIELRGAK